MPVQGNSPSLEDLMKQLATSNLEFQYCDMQFQQNMNATIQDLKMQIGQLANVVSHLQSAGSNNLPLQTIQNPKGNVSALMLRNKIVPLPFPTQTISTKKLDFDEELLRMFRKVEINIPLLDAIKQIPKYAKFLKELCVHKRKKMKGSVERGGIVMTLTRNEDFTVGAQTLPKKCRDPEIFSIPCTIGNCTFTDAMLDLGASINVMPICPCPSQRAYLPNGLIFPTDFYVLDMEDETSGKRPTLILGRPFLMTAKTKIDVYSGTLSMEFGDTLVQFNIFEAMKHPTEDHSLFGIDLIEELVEEYFQSDSSIFNDNSSSPPPPMELKPLPSHLKYAYLDTKQQLQIIIANNLHQEQEDKLLQVLRQHKKAIGWKLFDLRRINPSISMHRILMEEEAKNIRQQ
ncbi:hypothetical protein CR513_10619, partial [Mucuna pruriens]